MTNIWVLKGYVDARYRSHLYDLKSIYCNLHEVCLIIFNFSWLLFSQIVGENSIWKEAGFRLTANACYVRCSKGCTDFAKVQEAAVKEFLSKQEKWKDKLGGVGAERYQQLLDWLTTPTHTHSQMHTHTLSLSNAHTPTQIQTHTHTHTLSLKCIHTYTHWLIFTFGRDRERKETWPR